MAIIDKVKTSLGITSGSRNADIELAIVAAKKDMAMHGIRVVDENDPKTIQAIILYCRAWYNFQGDGDRYNQLYEHSANGMAVDTEYRRGGS